MDTQISSEQVQPPRHKVRIASTFITVLCIVQIPLSLIALSVTASVFAQGPAMLCAIGHAATQALYDQGYEYEQINRLRDEPDE